MSLRSSSLVRPRPRPTHRSKKTATHHWVRVVHVYTSMTCLLLVLFFSVSGLTLNHPTWTLGAEGSRDTLAGTLPAHFRGADAVDSVDWLRVAEFLRTQHGLRGSVTEHDVQAGEGSISFRGPGYAADGFFQVETGSYELTVTRQGLLAIFNDLHKGRNTTSSWRWLIDLSAGFLVVISLTGLTLQFFLRKRRRSALTSAGVGVVVFAVLVWLVMR